MMNMKTSNFTWCYRVSDGVECKSSFIPVPLYNSNATFNVVYVAGYLANAPHISSYFLYPSLAYIRKNKIIFMKLEERIQKGLSELMFLLFRQEKACIFSSDKHHMKSAHLPFKYVTL